MSEVESGSRPSEVVTVTDLDKALEVVAQFHQDAFDEADVADSEDTWNTAALAGNMMESLEVVKRKPDVYDHERTALFVIPGKEKIAGLGFVAVTNDSVLETFVHEGERITLPHVETIGAVLVSERGWNALRLGLETIKTLQRFGVTRFLVRLSADSKPLMERYFQRGLVKELTPLNDEMKHYIVGI